MSAVELSYETTSNVVETAAGTLHYHRAGDGPPLVLLHGSGPGVSGWANFGPVLATFAATHTTYVLDFPGCGASAVPAEGHPFLSAIGSVPAFLDALALERVSIIGNSMGGGVGVAFGIEHPERLLRLVTIGGVGLSVFSPNPSEGILRLTAFMEEPTRPRMVEWLQSMVFDQSMVTDELIDTRMELATRPATLDWFRRMYSREALDMISAMTRNPPAWPIWAQLHRLQAPTLLAWGRDDRVTPLDGCLVPMRMIPRCELHVFPDCGHWAMHERKEEFESTVAAFLGRDL